MIAGLQVVLSHLWDRKVHDVPKVRHCVGVVHPTVLFSMVLVLHSQTSCCDDNTWKVQTNDQLKYTTS